MKLHLVLTFFFTSNFAQSQTCDCKVDLDFIVEKMKKMPSYKKQIKGDKKIEFENSYNNLASQMAQPLALEDCYKLLLQQTLLINDTHSNLNVVKDVLPKKELQNTTKVNAFKLSSTFKRHPKTNLDLETLKQILAVKPIDAIEGIYTYGKSQKIGVYYSEDKKELIGVLLENTLNHWEVGEIRFIATHTNGVKYNLYYYDIDTRKPGFVKSISLDNGRLWSYKKVGNSSNVELPIKDQSDWEFKAINDDTQYIYFGTFGNSKKKEHLKFYKEVERQLTAKNVIVDLRSNRGGNKKFSDVYLKLLKNKNIYILTNCFTGSNGEQFTLKLRRLNNANHLGQTTRGVIAYGKNYGYNFNTLSGYFNFTPTDMNFHKFIEFEGKGISPQIPLNFEDNWINQTLEVISSKNK